MIPFSAYNGSHDANLFDQNSLIPYLYKDNVPGLKQNMAGMQPSLFFKCYSDDIYEAILEDLRAHYIDISNQDIDEDEEQEDEGMGGDEHMNHN
jgi:hypothetical protein